MLYFVIGKIISIGYYLQVVWWAQDIIARIYHDGLDLLSFVFSISSRPITLIPLILHNI